MAFKRYVEIKQTKIEREKEKHKHKNKTVTLWGQAQGPKIVPNTLRVYTVIYHIRTTFKRVHYISHTSFSSAVSIYIFY